MATNPYRRLIWHGAVIFLLAAVSGWLLLFVAMRNPRMMLSTHLAALFGALLLMVIGMLGPQLEVGPKARAALIWPLVVSQYGFVLAGIYAAFTGTSSMFAGPPGMRGTPVREAIAMAGNLVGVVGASIAALVLLWGLRARRHPPG